MGIGPEDEGDDAILAQEGDAHPAIGSSMSTSGSSGPRRKRGAKAASSVTAADHHDSDYSVAERGAEGGSDDGGAAPVPDKASTKRAVGSGAPKKAARSVVPGAPNKRKGGAGDKALTAAAHRKPVTAKAAAQVSNLEPSAVADNLIGVLCGASLAVRTSAEEVLAEVAARGWLPDAVRQSLWDAVAAGTSSLHQGRVHAAVCVASAMQEAREGVGDAATAAARASLEVAAAARPHLHAALARARSALAVLSMVAAGKQQPQDHSHGVCGGASGEDETARRLQRLADHLRCTCSVLDPTRLPPGAPSGRALMILAANAAGLHPTDPVVMALDIGGGTCGDYRLATHACDVLVNLVRSDSQGVIRVVDAAGAAASIAAASAPKDGRSRKKGPVAAAPSHATGGSAVDTGADGFSRTALAALVSRALSGVLGMIRGDWDGGDVESPHWYTAAQHGLDAIFSIAPQPVAVCEGLLRSMTDGSMEPTILPPVGREDAGGSFDHWPFILSRSRLSRLFFVAGHVALKTLLALEAAAAKVKAIRAKAAEGGIRPTETKGRGAGVSKAAGGHLHEAGGIEDQLGGGATDADAEAELVGRIAETELLVPARALCGIIAPLVSAVVSETLQKPPVGEAAPPSGGDTLAQSALLALCKMMSVSNEFATAHLPLLFTVLGAAQSASMRSCVVVALGDLAFRFPNSVEPYTHVRLQSSRCSFSACFNVMVISRLTPLCSWSMLDCETVMSACA
jgi:hypothetical protein